MPEMMLLLIMAISSQPLINFTNLENEDGLANFVACALPHHIPLNITPCL